MNKQQMTDILNIELNKPRTCSKQAKRKNYRVDGIEGQYRVSSRNCNK